MSTQAHELPDTGRLDIDDAKERLRQVLRQHRRKRHRHPARGHDAVCESLTTHALEAVKGMDRVAAYVSVGHEPCTRLLLERLTERGVRVLLPVLGPHLSRSWAYYRGAADLAERAPGRPPEPGGRVLPPEEVGRVDALLVPASDLGSASGPSEADGRSAPATRDAVGSAEGVGALEGIGAQGTGSPTEGVGASDGAGAPGAISAPNGSAALATASAGAAQSGIPDGARPTGMPPREEHWLRIRDFLGLAANTVAPDELSCACAGPGGALAWWAWWD